MAKRFTDSEKWGKTWWMELSSKNKVFWMYLLDNCNHAGIWEVNWRLAKFHCEGISENEIKVVFKKQYEVLNDGKKWFIKDFIEFQYGTLNENVKAHKSVINILSKYKIKTVTKQLANPLQRVLDKDKDMVKDKNIKRWDDFEEFYELYPKRVKKPKAFLKYKLALKKTTHEKIMSALKNQIKVTWNGQDKQFIPAPDSWLLNERWDDEVEKPDQKLDVKKEKKYICESCDDVLILEETIKPEQIECDCGGLYEEEWLYKHNKGRKNGTKPPKPVPISSKQKEFQNSLKNLTDKMSMR